MKQCELLQKEEPKKVIKNVVIVEKDIDQNLCIKYQELKALFDFYKPGDPRRIAWMLLATVGMRPKEVAGGKDENGEIQGLTVKCLLNDFSYIKYKVRKPVVKYYPNTGTVVKVFKKRTRPILYSTLKYELKQYCLKNYHTFKDGKIFSFNEEKFRKELIKIRRKVQSGELKEEIWKGFTELATDNVWCENNSSFRQQWRITPYSCRRFYNTYKLWCAYGGDIVLSTRDMGHTHVDTNMIYSYSPDKIGLSEDHIKERVTFDMLFGQRFKSQISLGEFI